ncbi:MAG: copper amine oxidase N-terminal domain-containing protein, partial [Clostridiales bacterium]|nr:copper amine oxidase N-terminal domain-containing protein [Clostridiales bacterium]
SYASLNKTKTIRDDVLVSDQYLKITTRDEVETGSSIIISFTNAKVPKQEQIDAVYQYAYYDWKGPSEGFWDVVPKLKTYELPYSIKRVGASEIQVTLINLPRRYADNSLYFVNGVSKRPVYNIRLPFRSDGEGTIKITIDNNESTISSATLSGYNIWSKYGSQTSSSGLTDTEGEDGEILEETTVEETTSETTTHAYSSSSSGSSGSADVTEDETEETTELDIFEMEADDLIAVRDLSDIIAEYDESSYVDWDSSTKTVTISYKGSILQFISDSDYYILNDEIIYFDGVSEEYEDYEEGEEPVKAARATIIDRKMYVPVGAAIEALGLEPDDEETAEETTTEAETEETTEAAEEAEEPAETETTETAETEGEAETAAEESAVI